MYRALIPVKKLEEVKSRLAPHLSQAARATLMLDMLHHVIEALRASEAFERISVVSPDARVLEQARHWGAWPRREETRGHNPALHAAALHDLADGVSGLLTISADLPLLHPEDIRGLLASACEHDLVLAPSREGTGTNALFAQPPLVVPYRFGLDSLRQHRQEAERAHLRHTLYSSIGLSLDIDTIEDLECSRDLAEMCQSGHAVYL
ncbi:MAG: 2-phospho-L-lactate guanylyltransferase [Ktedonobacteraceae bacterium]|nr:2-phospho-L-lactate guanylyltransferase [Ktedonobacteraceae bacterium]